jgi:hypothetical protein
LDNFAGSGTTLVEAKLEGHPSIGIDMSPLATFAGRVKSEDRDLDKVGKYAEKAVRLARLSLRDIRVVSSKALDKWFTHEAQVGLQALKSALLCLPAGKERDFLLLAFLAIVRRVSRAYDGEVRPHINSAKPERDVLEAFTRKVADMTKRASEYHALASPSVDAIAVTGDSRQLRKALDFSEHPVGLIISHPPYLNCFDYVPVYKLEYIWATDIPELGRWEYKQLRRDEMRSWPATDADVFETYFDGLRQAFEEVYRVAIRGARCCVVLGDCTIHGKVVHVIDKLIAIMESIGFRTEKLVYRSTHYGTGKYAYADRAHYHGDDAEKRDGITIFRKY